jgi:hypothetical protein
MTCSSRRAVARNWGGKGEPTAEGQRIETLAAIFFRSFAVVGLQVGERDCTIPGFQAYDDAGFTLDWAPKESSVVGCKTGRHDTRDCAIGLVLVE